VFPAVRAQRPSRQPGVVERAPRFNPADGSR